MTLTHTNLSSLVSCIVESEDGQIRHVEATDARHIRRCITLGLLERGTERVGRGYSWKLSESGAAEVRRYIEEHRRTWFRLSDKMQEKIEIANLRLEDMAGEA